ncbi:MAG: DUF1415 domain-containing protein [Glaciimonas sp.]|nr:DUF1415 domain-containing protein [Glaciimonas sp.]
MSDFSKQTIANIKLWLECAVIGLNLCPFTKAVYVKNQIRFVVSEAQTNAELMKKLNAELDYLHQADQDVIDTTLLIYPLVLGDFLDYKDFFDDADALLQMQGLEGDIQIASFHPEYQFAGTQTSDITNYTNRSPYPMLHLLREDSVNRALKAFPKAVDIFEKNTKTLTSLGETGWKKLGLVPIAKARNASKLCFLSS